MSAAEVSNQIIHAMNSKRYNFIIANYANVDVLGHSGDIRATASAVEVVDHEVGKVADVCRQNDFILMITADHGNAEQMIKVTDMNADREVVHTINPVPFIMAHGDSKQSNFRNISGENMLSDILKSDGTLADVAPTILEIFGIPVPREMTGISLLNRLE